MADEAALPTEELLHSRDLGAVIYMGAYIRLMCRELKVPEPTSEGLKPMILEMVDPLNHAVEAIWRAMMEDNSGAKDALARFRESLDIHRHNV